VIAILIITHGALGESLVDSAAHILGARPSRVGTLAVEPSESPAQIVTRARALALELDEGSGVLIMGDICGATPCNAAAQLVESGKTEMVTGANLPMLMRALTYRSQPLATVVDKALSGGTEGVMRLAATH
jgi:mannose PTS system EIIA component